MKDHTLVVLKEIRDEMREFKHEMRDFKQQTVERLDTTVERLDTTVERLDRLERRQVETEVRLATELVAVVGAVHELRDAVLEDRALRSTVVDHEGRIAALEKRVS